MQNSPKLGVLKPSDIQIAFLVYEKMLYRMRKTKRLKTVLKLSYLVSRFPPRIAEETVFSWS